MQKISTSAQTEQDRLILASIVETSEDAIISKRLDGKILSWNRAAEKLFGYRRREIVGQRITKLFPRDRMAEERMILNHVRRGERVEHYETVRIRKNGQPVDVSISVSPIWDANGRIVGASQIARDITKIKQAEEARRHSEQLMRAILDAAADAIITIDERGLIRSVNAATERLFGYASVELVGQNVNRLMPEPFHKEHNGYLRNYCRTGKAKIIGIGREVTGKRKDGTTFPMHLAVSEVRLKDRRLFTGIVHDLTGRRRLERQIMEAAANEQRRIGQDLHDGLCQDLIGIAFSIDAAARNSPTKSDNKLMVKLAASVRDAASQARRLAHGLNPVDLKAGGLPAALENLAAKVSDSFGVRCIFQWDRVAHVREDATATHLYRIAQEAVSNAIRHGQADSIQINFAEQGGSLILSVTDNGKGIPEAIADSVKQGLSTSKRTELPKSGMGLQTMHYRARVIGGSLAVMLRKGGGTTVVCTVELERSIQQDKTSGTASENLSRSKRGRSR